jgi:hypothetical protein
VGTNIERLLGTRGQRQDDLARTVRDAGLGKWDQSVVSKIVRGTRALTFEEVIVLAAALGIPVVDLVAGDGDVALGQATVTAAQVRDVLAHGHVLDEHRADGALDRLASSAARPGFSLTASIAAELDCPEHEVEHAAIELWNLPVSDELERRTRQSVRAFTGLAADDPRVFDLTALGSLQVSTRQVRAWRGHHIAHMTEDLRDYL